MMFKKIIVTVAIISLPASAALRSGTDYQLQTDSANQGGTKSTSANYIVRQGAAGQGAAGKSDSANYSAGQGYIYTTNTKPATPESLAQYKADGTTLIPWPAGWTFTSTEVMKMTIKDYDPGDILLPQIEVQLSGESFANAPSFEGSAQNYGGTTLAATITATSMEHAKTYIWQARVKDLENFYSDWVAKGGDPDYRVDLVPPASSELLTAFATPEPSPVKVYLTWEAGLDALSGVAGYNLYRSPTPGSGYSRIQYLVSGLSTNDAAVSLGTDYYYVMRTQDLAGGESGNSIQASAPYLAITREGAVVSPVGGGYSGSAADAVPGSTINYIMYYTNLGFAVSTSIEVVDRIPEYTDFKIGTATGEAVTQVKYSNDSGATFTYTPSGTYVDPAVTHVKWLCGDVSSGATGKVEFSVVIR
jgi:uncharacterized repeat protein (TIGR01451 family)